ncbi:MAG TPA: site-specific DNA-methyltransferase [Mycobacteriales bacterium]|nr:site-specific DNA-methyltransferase [Mycobacteriales bacterium]
MNTGNPNVYYRDEHITLLLGDAAEQLATLPNGSVDAVVTSPPYWGLRDYDADGQYGLEATPNQYVNNLRAVFDEIHRVLADTGTVWLNLADSYASGETGRVDTAIRYPSLATRRPDRGGRRHRASSGLPRKNLVGLPWRVALAVQADGWILRNALVWHKPNAMPESVRDRLSCRYEFVFLLVKQPRYYFDLDAIREPLAHPSAAGMAFGGRKGSGEACLGASRRRRGSRYRPKYTTTRPFPTRPHGAAVRPTGHHHDTAHPHGKNPGDVWSIPTRPYRQAHFATFPVDLPLRCIRAGCPPGGLVADPFSGAATTGLAALQLGRDYLGIELNHAFHDLAKARLFQQMQHSARRGDGESAGGEVR